MVFYYQWRMLARCNCRWRHPAHWFRHQRRASTAPAPVHRPAATATTATWPASPSVPSPPGAPFAETGPRASTTEPPPAMDAKDSSGDPFVKITSTPAGLRGNENIRWIGKCLIKFTRVPLLLQVQSALRGGQRQAESMPILPTGQMFQSWHEKRR